MKPQFLIANHKGTMRPTARLSLESYTVRDIDDGYAEHGADVAIPTQRGALLVYVHDRVPPESVPLVGDWRYDPIARLRGHWQLFLADASPWRWREVRRLTPEGYDVADALRTMCLVGAALWPDGLQETEYLRPSERLGGPAATEAAVDRAIAQGWLKP